MANSELSNCNLFPVEYIDPRFISVAITCELAPACSFHWLWFRARLRALRGSSQEWCFVGRGAGDSRRKVLLVYLSTFSPGGSSVKPPQAV